MKICCLRATVYTDTGFINTKSLKQNTCYQGYSCENFIHIDPMRGRKESGDSLFFFATDIGAPALLILENVIKLLCLIILLLHKPVSCILDNYQANHTHNDKTNLNSKLASWNVDGKVEWLPTEPSSFSGVILLFYKSWILSMIACGKDGITGIEKVAGDTVDIMKWLNFFI